MTDHISHRNTRYLGRLATVCGMPILAFGLAANATAAPDDGEWDIEEYDVCMQKTVRNPDLCCIDSGGVPTSDPEDTQPDGSPNCYAPAAAPGQSGQPPLRPLPPGFLNDLPTAVLDPAQPPPAVAPPTVPVGPAMG